MNTTETCPHCEAKMDLELNGDIVYGCGAVKFAGKDAPNRTSLCMQRQIEQLTVKNAVLEGILEYMKQREEGR